MDISTGPLIERIARVLAAQRLSANARGNGSSVSAAVDAVWRDYVADADAVLRTMREPDERMASVGDLAIWERMVRAAIEQGA